MASTDERDPAVGDVVHFIAYIGGSCQAAIICGLPADGDLPDGAHDLDPVYLAVFGKSAGLDSEYEGVLLERSEDGHANTWHRPCDP